MTGFGRLGGGERATTALRRIVGASSLAFLMEAHDGISAKIVEETRFDGVWASGLSIATSLGVRDCNEASWTQVLDVVEFMCDAVDLPVLVDGDTGWGNFNNARRVARKFCERGAAGICIEDKLFPKTNSFVGQGQPLVSIDEFCGKIKAAQDSKPDDDFVLVARTEALVSGKSLSEALERAEAYRVAGADAILVHSKQRSPHEVLAFLERWQNRAPVFVVPTRFYTTPTAAFRRAGVSVVVWANHNLRSAIAGMRSTCRQIRDEESVAGVEARIASLDDVFELVGNPELDEAQQRYLSAPAGAGDDGSEPDDDA